MTDELKDILEGDFKYVLIEGDYFDCPSCNPTTSFSTTTHWDEKTLLDHMVKWAGRQRMEAIWVLDSYNGNMQKYCDIETRSSFHRVHTMAFKLPEKGDTMIIADKGGYRLADDAEMVLYGTKT